MKNSETEISRWRAPISTAETVGTGLVTGGLGAAAPFGGAAAFGGAARFDGATRFSGAARFSGAPPFGAAAAFRLAARLDARLRAFVFDGI